MEFLYQFLSAWAKSNYDYNHTKNRNIEYCTNVHVSVMNDILTFGV